MAVVHTSNTLRILLSRCFIRIPLVEKCRYLYSDVIVKQLLSNEQQQQIGMERGEGGGGVAANKS